VDIVIADSEDSASIDSMISKTEVLVNFAGPYAEHGESVFKSCIKHGTDYIDLTGETFWLREMIDKYHEQAREKRVKLIPVCGYEAAPFDIATLMAALKLKQEFNEECTAVSAIATFITKSPDVMKGRNFTAGTAGSTQVILESNNARALKDPYYLDPELRPESVLSETEGYDLVARYDSERGAWMASMFPGHSQNPPVVHRSHALFAERGAGYGSNFRYREAADASGFAPNATGQKIAAKAICYIPNNIIKAIEGGSRIRHAITRFVINRVKPEIGQGPKEEMLDKFHYRIDITATSPTGKKVTYRVNGSSNPGYRSTSQIAIEAGLCLALDRDQLPDYYGIVTPATGMGLQLVDRLARAGVTFDFVPAQ